jgi:hypothetical protein
MEKTKNVPKRKLELKKKTIARLNLTTPPQAQGNVNLTTIGLTCDTQSGDNYCNTGTATTSN